MNEHATTEMRHALALLHRLMNELAEIADADAAKRALMVYCNHAEWLVREGHGNVTLSAKNHRLNPKLRIDSVRDSGDIYERLLEQLA